MVRILHLLLISLSLLSCGDAERAVAQPRDAGATPEVSGSELYGRGKAALSEGRYREAIRHLRAAADAGQGDVELFYWLAKAHWSRGQGTEAASAYVQAIALDPEATSAWSLYAMENVAEVYTRTDRLAESRAAYERALLRETRPEWITKIRNQLAELDLTEGIYEPDERTRFNDKGEVIGGVGPDGMRTNRNFEIARHTSDPEKEAKYYRLAVQTDPGMYQSPFNLGLALARMGKHEEAVPWLLRSDEVFRKDEWSNPHGEEKADAHAFLALCYLELGDAKKAAHHADKALAASPTLFWAMLYDSRVKVANGKADEALLLLEALVADSPDHPEVLQALSEAYTALGRSGEARATLADAIDAVPDGHPWQNRLAGLWKKRLR